jgi:hypothetical protein
MQPDDVECNSSHWILHPAFAGKRLFVSIDLSHSHFGGTSKWVQIDNGIAYIQKQGGHSESIDLPFIIKPIIAPLCTCKSLLAIVTGDHTGKLVRCIKWMLEDNQERLYVACAQNAGTLSETLDDNVFPVYRWEVVEIEVGSEAQKHGKMLIKQLQKKLNSKRQP